MEAPPLGTYGKHQPLSLLVATEPANGTPRQSQAVCAVKCQSTLGRRNVNHFAEDMGT